MDKPARIWPEVWDTLDKNTTLKIIKEESDLDSVVNGALTQRTLDRVPPASVLPAMEDEMGHYLSTAAVLDELSKPSWLRCASACYVNSEDK